MHWRATLTINRRPIVTTGTPPNNLMQIVFSLKWLVIVRCRLNDGSSVTLDRHRLARERDIEDSVRRAINLIEIQDRRHIDEVVSVAVRDIWLTQLMRENHPSFALMQAVHFSAAA